MVTKNQILSFKFGNFCKNTRKAWPYFQEVWTIYRDYFLKFKRDFFHEVDKPKPALA